MAATISETFKINSAIHNCFPVISCIQRFKDEKIIITESVNLTLVYDLSKLFCVRSFTFTSLLPLSAPIVYDSAGDQLVAIKGRTKIDLIKAESECDEVRSIKLNKDQTIRCVLAGANCPCLVVFESNRVCELEKILQNESADFTEDGAWHQLEAPSGDLERLVVVASAINNLRFWAEFVDQQQDRRHYVLFNFNFILNELTKQTTIESSQRPYSISFSADSLLAIGRDQKLRELSSRSPDGELIFEPTLQDGDELLDHGYLALKDNVSAIALLTYNPKENANHLSVYDLNLKLEMKRIALPIQSEHRQVKLNCFGSHIFAQTAGALIYVPVQTEELSLADLIGSYKSQLNLTEMNLTFEGIMKYLKGNLVKPIDREFLLVEALEQFIVSNREELEQANINELCSQSMGGDPTSDQSTGDQPNGDCRTDQLPAKLNQKLRKLFAFTFNGEFMIQQLKRKQFEREFLIKILDLLNKALNSQTSGALVNVIDWINLVFDAYFICLNSANNLQLVRHLQQIRTQTDQLILKSKNEKDLKCLLATLLLANLTEATPDEDGTQHEASDSDATTHRPAPKRRSKRARIVLPDSQHLGYKLEEICL